MRNKSIFIPVNKTGCTSLRDVVQDYSMICIYRHKTSPMTEKSFIRRDSIDNQTWEMSYKYAIARNPFDRVVSGWKDKIKNKCFKEFVVEDLAPDPPYYPNQLNMKDLAIPFLNDMADLNIIKKSSIDLWTKPYPLIFCNFWAAKQEVFIDYVDNFLSKVFELIESYDKDNWIFNACNRYPKPPKAWQDSTGFSRYPIITFILERLINIYLQDRNLNHQATL